MEIFEQASANCSVSAGKDIQSLPREVYSIYPVSPPRTPRQRERERGRQGKCTREEGNGKEKTERRVGVKWKGILRADVAGSEEESTERLGHRLLSGSWLREVITFYTFLGNHICVQSLTHCWIMFTAKSTFWKSQNTDNHLFFFKGGKLFYGENVFSILFCFSRSNKNDLWWYFVYDLTNKACLRIRVQS